MKLIRFISTLVVVAFLMAAIGSSAWADGTKRPNIIFVLTDDISPKDYAFYGGKTASPVLETMAKEGLYFKTAWATPRCMPTRAMLLTGKYPFRNKVFENQVNPQGTDGRIKPVGERFVQQTGLRAVWGRRLTPPSDPISTEKNRSPTTHKALYPANGERLISNQRWYTFSPPSGAFSHRHF